MKEYALLFRQPKYDYRDVPAETMKALSQQWQDWVEGIVSQGKFSSHGLRLAPEGKVLASGGLVTDGPFVEIKEALLSFIVVQAEDLDDAVTLAHGCPAIDQGGCVEVRPVFG